MADILEIPCLQIFFSFCQRPTIRDVIHGHAKAWSINRDPTDGSEGCEVRSLANNIASKLSVRIDYLKIEAGGKTGWSPHNGYEFAFVFQGKGLRFLIGESEDRDQAKPFQVQEDEAIAFPSGLWHCIENIGGNEAILAVARPAKCRPVTLDG
ncbi:hypothetical protein HAHE_25200 [Haloferula helveola]|uniref:Cupin type-2 domain-containing protein n=2 Tax=Haloferula helveola TaxID=490095 RepID=A0ABM7RER4_9BACT|nr:hypothetical protein HAHE_25200 [Haloferula helveola]